MSLLDGLAAWWELDEASGTRVDIHGGNDLTSVNGVGSAAGKIGSAADFVPASAQYLTHVENAALSAQGDWTFAIWIKGRNLPAYFPGIAEKDWPVQGWVIYADAGTSALSFAVNADAGYVQTWAALNDTWMLVIVWRDQTNGQIGISVDDSTPVTANWAGTILDGGANLNIGANPAQSIYWDGALDQPAFWHRVLSAPERTALHNGGAALSYATLLAASQLTVQVGGAAVLERVTF